MKGLIFGILRYAFFSCKTFLAILMLISRKSVQRRGIGEKKKRFFRYSPAVRKKKSNCFSFTVLSHFVCCSVEGKTERKFNSFLTQQYS